MSELVTITKSPTQCPRCRFTQRAPVGSIVRCQGCDTKYLHTPPINAKYAYRIENRFKKPLSDYPPELTEQELVDALHDHVRHMNPGDQLTLNVRCLTHA